MLQNTTSPDRVVLLWISIYASPTLNLYLQHNYEIRQCVLLKMCQQWGTPSPLAGPLFRFQISKVVLFFPFQPRTSCRGNDNKRGKQQISKTIPSTYQRSRLTHFFSFSLPQQSCSFSICMTCLTLCSALKTAFLLISSTS